MTKNETLEMVTDDFLCQLVVSSVTDLGNIENNLLTKVHEEFETHNVTATKETKWKLPEYLEFWQIAEIILYVFSVKNVMSCPENKSNDTDLLALYVNNLVASIIGDDSKLGIYDTSENTIQLVAEYFKCGLTTYEHKEIIAYLQRHAERVVVCENRDLIAVNNGIFNYNTKELQNFSPEYVFLTKSNTNLNFNAVNPIITMPNGEPWDVESWMYDLNDDKDISALFWEITSALLRPNVRWNKAILPISSTGNNGKGTLIQMWRELLGTGTYCSIPICDFGKRFATMTLIRSSAVLVDENNVSQYVEENAAFKAVVTQDAIQIDRKNKEPITYRFHGLIVEALNDIPRVRDRSSSFIRRLLFIPMTKCFTGAEISEIKEDYLKRPEVLEYVMKKALVDTNFYKFSEPDACKRYLAEFQEYNDPVTQFWNDFREQFVWDLLPFQFLYDLYKAWNILNNPSGKPLGKNTFINDLRTIIQKDDEWNCELYETNKKYRTGDRLNKPEPLIVQYDLRDWLNKNYKGTNPSMLALPSTIATNYRGVLRVGTASADDDAD